MIKVNFNPVRSDDAQLKAEWQSTVLTVSGEAFDLSLLEDGATAKHPTLGTVERNGDDYEVTLRLPHGPQEWQRTNNVTPPRYYVGESSYTDRDEALAYARTIGPVEVRIERQRRYVRASVAQRFPSPVTVEVDGEIPVPEPEEDWRDEDTDDEVEKFTDEAWPEPDQEFEA